MTPILGPSFSPITSPPLLSLSHTNTRGRGVGARAVPSGAGGASLPRGRGDQTDGTGAAHQRPVQQHPPGNNGSLPRTLVDVGRCPGSLTTLTALLCRVPQLTRSVNPFLHHSFGDRTGTELPHMTGKAHCPRPRLCSYLSPSPLSLTSLPRLSLASLSLRRPQVVGPRPPLRDPRVRRAAAHGAVVPGEQRGSGRTATRVRPPGAVSEPFTLPMAVRLCVLLQPRYTDYLCVVSCHVTGQVRIDLTSTYSMSFRSSFLDIRDWYVQIQPSRPSSLPPPAPSCPTSQPHPPARLHVLPHRVGRALINVPLMGEMDLHTFWGDADLRFCAYCVPDHAVAARDRCRPTSRTRTHTRILAPA